MKAVYKQSPEKGPGTKLERFSTCCDGMSKAILFGAVSIAPYLPSTKHPVEVKAEGHWGTLPISFCPFCSASIKVCTVQPITKITP